MVTWPHCPVSGQLSKTRASDSGGLTEPVPCTEERAFHFSATWLHGSSGKLFNQTH